MSVEVTDVDSFIEKYRGCEGFQGLITDMMDGGAEGSGTDLSEIDFKKIDKNLQPIIVGVPPSKNHPGAEGNANFFKDAKEILDKSGAEGGKGMDFLLKNPEMGLMGISMAIKATDFAENLENIVGELAEMDGFIGDIARGMMPFVGKISGFIGKAIGKISSFTGKKSDADADAKDKPDADTKTKSAEQDNEAEEKATKDQTQDNAEVTEANTETNAETDAETETNKSDAQNDGVDKSVENLTAAVNNPYNEVTIAGNAGGALVASLTQGDVRHNNVNGQPQVAVYKDPSQGTTPGQNIGPDADELTKGMKFDPSTGLS